MEPFNQWFQQRNGIKIELPDDVIDALSSALGGESSQTVDFELQDGTRLSDIQVVNGHVAVVSTDVDPSAIKAIYIPGQDEPIEFAVSDAPVPPEVEEQPAAELEDPNDPDDPQNQPE